MVALVIVFLIVSFITADVIIRIVMRRMDKNRIRKERRQALDKGLMLDFADEAKTLKRVEVDNPKARILAVDDEEVILDSFRKILVLAGYSIDTVERGSEALTLLKTSDYDFVFTDIKMPEMDGVEVAKAVKHLCPEVDVIVITGYATIETAVETMKYGAMDYIQKPFTEDELVVFVDKSLILRQDRIDRQIRPKAHLVTPSSGVSTSKHEFNVPAGTFISSKHSWVHIEADGSIRVGIDDFTQKIIGSIDAIELPKQGRRIKKGDPLFTIKKGTHRIVAPSPVGGKTISVNNDLLTETESLKIDPYRAGWVCAIEPSNLSQDLQDMRIGVDAVSWYQKEVDKYMEIVKRINEQRDSNEKLLEAFCNAFFHNVG